MTRHAMGLRAIVIGGLLMALAACSSSSTSLDGRTAATPGSEQDFIVNVGDRVFFPTDQTNLTDAGMDTLRRQAAWLKLYPQVKILVEGHADERGTREYNLALSARRGANSKTFLIAQGSIRAGYARSPTARNDRLPCATRNPAGRRTGAR